MVRGRSCGRCGEALFPQETGVGGRCAIPELRPFNRQLGTPLHKSQLLGMC